MESLFSSRKPERTARKVYRVPAALGGSPPAVTKERVRDLLPALMALKG